MEKVSIIIPIYNLERELERCLESIRNQTYDNLQILLLDDGSKDKSLEICKKYAKNDSRFSVFHHDNRGVAYTRNRGIDLADGKYIMFIDGDDVCYPDMIEQYMRIVTKFQVDVVIGAIKMVEEDGNFIIKKPLAVGRVKEKKFWEQVCKDESGIYGYIPNKLYLLNRIKENNIRFREDMTVQEDFEFALEVFNVSDCFYEFSYYGYVYYHQENKREIPAENLLHNQIKLRKYAVNNKADEKCVLERIRKMVYIALFYSGSIKQISELRKIKGLEETLIINAREGLERKFIIRKFLNNNFRFIYLYFKIRKMIVRSIKRGEKS